MEHFGLKMRGTFIAEVIPFLKEFTVDDIGRFIYVTATDNYYFGTNFDWIQVGLTPKCIKVENIDFGFSYNQLNAIHIPFRDTFLKSKTVSDALKELSFGGAALKSNSIFSNHLTSKCVNLNHLDFGISGVQISAKDIPIISLLHADVVDIQSAVNKLETNHVQILRKKILNTNWDYDFILNMYVGHVSTIPIITMYVIVQCYDNNNILITPKKILLDLYYNRIYIYYTESIELNVVILG